MSTPPPPRLTCPVQGCGKSFASTTSLSRHRYIHDPSLMVHQCHLCQKFFSRKYKLTEHIRLGKCPVGGSPAVRVTVKVSESSPAHIKDKPKKMSPPSEGSNLKPEIDSEVDRPFDLDMDPPFHGFGAPGSDDYFQIQEALAKRRAARGLKVEDLVEDLADLNELPKSNEKPIGWKTQALEIIPVQAGATSGTVNTAEKSSKRKVLEIIPIQNNNLQERLVGTEAKQCPIDKQESRKSSRKRKLKCLDDFEVEESQSKRVKEEPLDEDAFEEESLFEEVTMLCSFFSMR